MPMQEVWLHHIWGNRLYESLEFEPHPYIPADSHPEVLDVGEYNRHGGPDFFNVKLRIGSVTWAGNGEIHIAGGDWYRHHHHRDAAYNNVILHIVLQDTGPVQPLKGVPPITCILKINPQLIEYAKQLTEAKLIPRCGSDCSTLPESELQQWIDHLYHERLTQRLEQIIHLAHEQHGDTALILHQKLFYYLGSTVNNDAFEQIAQSLPPTILLKHRDSLIALEALLLGQANLLYAPPSTAQEVAVPISDYQSLLQREYSFLRHKYGLTPIPEEMLRKLRIRPASSPHRRLALIAALYHTHAQLPSRLLRCSNLDAVHNILKVSVSNFWQTHYSWTATSHSPLGHASRSIALTIAVNVIIPLQYYMRSLEPDIPLIDIKALPPEQNSILRSFGMQGLSPTNALHTQALLQLYKYYCLPNRCWACLIGRYLLRRYTPSTLHPSP